MTCLNPSNLPSVRIPPAQVLPLPVMKMPAVTAGPRCGLTRWGLGGPALVHSGLPFSGFPTAPADWFTPISLNLHWSLVEFLAILRQTVRPEALCTQEELEGQRYLGV